MHSYASKSKHIPIHDMKFENFFVANKVDVLVTPSTPDLPFAVSGAVSVPILRHQVLVCLA